METLKGNQKGYTALELLVVVAVSSMITYALFAGMRISSDQLESSDLRMTIQDSAREGLYRMTEEIRQSSPTLITIDPAGGNWIQFSVPDAGNTVNADYTVNWTSADLIRYSLGGTNGVQLLRNNLTTGAAARVISNDVSALNFTGNAANPTVVTVTMSVQRAMKNGRLIPAAPIQMTAQAEIRNV